MGESETGAHWTRNSTLWVFQSFSKCVSGALESCGGERGMSVGGPLDPANSVADCFVTLTLRPTLRTAASSAINWDDKMKPPQGLLWGGQSCNQGRSRGSHSFPFLSNSSSSQPNPINLPFCAENLRGTGSWTWNLTPWSSKAGGQVGSQVPFYK